LFSFSHNDNGVDECLILVQKLSQQIEYFAKRCKKNEPAKRITLQELTADHPSVELFVHSVRSSKISKWLILDGNFEIQKRRANKFEVLINNLSHIPQRFMDRCNLATYYVKWIEKSTVPHNVEAEEQIQESTNGFGSSYSTSGPLSSRRIQGSK